MTVLGGTTLCIYASMAILDTKYEAVVVVHESFTQTIESLPTEFKSSEGKAAWWSFFGNFGTHYYDSIVTGGKMQTNVSLERSKRKPILIASTLGTNRSIVRARPSLRSSSCAFGSVRSWS